MTKATQFFCLSMCLSACGQQTAAPTTYTVVPDSLRDPDALPSNTTLVVPNVLLPTVSEPAAVPGARVTLTLRQIPASVGVLSPLTFTVTAADGNGNLASYDGQVSFSCSDPQASVPAPYTFKAQDAGVHTFVGGLTFRTLASSQYVKVSDMHNPNVTALQRNITTHTFSAMSGHAQHACAIFDNSSVTCWGDNSHGQLGLGGRRRSVVNAGYLVRLGEKVQAIVAAQSHSCALLMNGEVACWGDDAYGQLGQESAPTTHAARTVSKGVRIVDLGEDNIAVALTASAYHTCALLDNAEVKCWGLNDVGQLGADVGLTPVPVNSPTPIIDVSAGRFETCALNASGDVYCWGEGRPLPKRVALADTATQVSSGTTHSCALLSSEKVACWRPDNVGEFSNSTVEVPITGVSVGAEETCLVLDQHHVSCANSASEPSTVGVIMDLTVVQGAVCALLDSGAIPCWPL